MSYILEALRKAERERAQSQFAGDGVAAQPSAGASRSRWGLVLIALLLVNAAAMLLLWLKPRAPTAAPAAHTVTIAKPSAPVPGVRPAPAPAAPQVEEEPIVQQGVQSMDDLGAAGEGANAPASETATTAEPPQGGRVTIAKHPLTAARPAKAAPATAVEAEEPEAPPDQPPVPVEPASAPSASVSPGASAPPAVKSLQDMSAAFQATFPRFTLEVHVYDPEPQRRFVLIDGQRYREGDTLAQGPRLLQIVPEGMVLDWRGDQVLYPIGRH